MQRQTVCTNSSMEDFPIYDRLNSTNKENCQSVGAQSRGVAITASKTGELNKK